MMTMCESCSGTGITPYSVMKAACIICNGSGALPDTGVPHKGTVHEGSVSEFVFLGDENDTYDDFRRRHICPRREGGGLGMVFTLSSGGGSGIGRNTYATCKQCGCMHDITDYEVW